DPPMTLIAKSGSRNAMRNASRASEVPKVRATISSLTTPTDLTTMVNAPMVTAAPKMLRFTEAPLQRLQPSATRNQIELLALRISCSLIGPARPVGDRADITPDSSDTT